MRVLLTGASGFVGKHLWPVLEGAGHQVLGLSRDPERARRRQPHGEWRQGDVGDERSVAAALEGCDASYYLVHGMAEGGDDYRSREVEAARSFSAAAASAGLRRIVYLGGMAPAGDVSEHLRSRLEVGAALREGAVPTIELRSSMIVGYGSLSWLMVRDLAARLPFMVLPRWLKSQTQPVAIEDVVAALTAALSLPLEESAWFDLPGPETLSGREILEQAAQAMELPRPLAIEVPVLSPWLSSHWVHFVTRAEWAVAREVVVGLKGDMLAHDERYWELISRRERIPFLEAARRALAEERDAPPGAGFWSAVETWRRRPRGRR